VRAAGKGVTIKKYFEKQHRDRNQYVSRSEVDRIVKEQVEAARQTLFAEFKAELSKFQQSQGQPAAQQPSHPQTESVNDSCTMPAHLSEIPTVIIFNLNDFIIITLFLH
jgi:hypothetical protein